MGASMIIRSNRVLEKSVIKGLELSLDGDYFGAVILMKNQGVPNKVIARVLCQQHQRRGSDLSPVNLCINSL
jgi:hypothetical protein